MKANLTFKGGQSFLPKEKIVGVGETVKKGLWKNQPTQTKIAQVARQALLILTAATAISLPIAFAVSPAMASIPFALSILLGTALVVQSFRKLNSFPPPLALKEKEKAPDFGEFSENKVFLGNNGPDTFKVKVDLMKRAKKTTNLLGSFHGGKPFDQVLNIMEDKLKEGVTVRICTLNDLLTPSNIKKIKYLAKTYPKSFKCLMRSREIRFAPHLEARYFHQKLLVVDSEVAVTGGTGIVDSFVSEPKKRDPARKVPFKESLMGFEGTRDQDAVVMGPSVRTIEKEIFRTFHKWETMTRDSVLVRLFSNQGIFGKLPLPKTLPSASKKKNSALKRYFLERYQARKGGKGLAAVISSGPEHGTENFCKKSYLKLIAEAKDEIVIGNHYFEEETIVKALIQAKKRGVKITVITNGAVPGQKLATQLPYCKSKLAFEKVVKHGIKAFQYGKPHLLYHKKIIVVDRKMLGIGSMNIYTQSYEQCEEELFLVQSRKIARKALKGLKEDIRDSKPFKVKKEWKPSIWDRIVVGVATAIQARIA